MESASLEELKNICRTCLRFSAVMHPLTHDSTLLEKIEMISSVQIMLTEEEFPTSICRDCLDNINLFFCFRKMIINSEKELKERYDSILVKLEMSFEEDNENYYEEKNVVSVQASPAPIVNEHCEKISDKQKKRVRKKVQGNNPTNVNITKSCTRFKTPSKRRRPAVTPGMCNVCGVIVRADNLRKHLRTHCEKSVECETCGKVVKNRESLRGHLLIHGDTIYTCETCNKTFRVKREYTRHLKSHKDPDLRKVICTLCGKKVSEMKRHLLSHTGERPFTCTYCKKGFTSSYALKVHTRQHKNEKPFVCEHCSMSFYQKASLVTHLRSEHNLLICK